MSDYVIMTDNTSDLPAEYIEENHIPILYLSYVLEGKNYGKEEQLPFSEFYQKMRAGSLPTTAQVNPEDAKEEFLKQLDQGKGVLHIAFSSGLSGSYNSARLAAEEIKEERPDARIVVVDSLCASLGEGLLVHKALQLQQQGKTMEEVVAWLEENKLHLCHMFTVDDLNHLYRGGRVSKATAILGTMINIKPLMHVDNEGHLIPLSKVRGRKKSLLALVDMMEERLGSYRDQNDIIFISHGDAREDAQFLADHIKERFGMQTFLIDYVGATIGAHSGPGTIALFFLGDHR